MRPLSASDLLKVWEQGLDQEAVARAITLLAGALPDTPRDALDRLSIGRRNALLLALRERTFGPRLAGLVPCPACGEMLELTCDTAALRDAPTGEDRSTELSVSHAGYEVSFRLPNTLDLAAVARAGDAETAERLLQERCLLSVRRDGVNQAGGELPAAVLEAVGERMTAVDPGADLRVSVDCPACATSSKLMLDVASFFWLEIHTWALRTLLTVHTLAAAYGWAEHDILAMGSARQQAYLELIGA